MESNFDPILCKKKFGVLFSRLHQMGFQDEHISRCLLEHPFLDGLERNEIETFRKTSVEDIARTVFQKENAFIDPSAPFIGEYYWAGEAYFSLLYQKHIPLRRSLVLYPLSKMVASFPLYHEMSFASFASDYQKVEEKTSLLGLLRKKKGLSLRELSLLTGIKEATLRSYCDNEVLYHASYQNIMMLSSALETKEETFKQRSSFCLLSYEGLHEPSFLKRFHQELNAYIGVDKDIPLVTGPLNEKEIREIAKQHPFFYLTDFAYIKYRSKVLYRFFSDSEVLLLIQKCRD